MVADILNEVYSDVSIELHLIPLTGEKLSNATITGDEARLDVSARGFWQRGQRAFFDVKVFIPFAPTHLNQKLKSAFVSNENTKKRTYNRRVVEVEHASFT